MGFHANLARIKATTKKAIDDQTTVPILMSSMCGDLNCSFREKAVPANRRDAPVHLLCEDHEKANDYAKKRNPFNKGSSDNHVCTNITGCLGLASHRFECRTANAANTYTCAYSGYTCADTCQTVV